MNAGCTADGVEALLPGIANDYQLYNFNPLGE
jgi:hypothetical protein